MFVGYRAKAVLTSLTLAVALGASPPAAARVPSCRAPDPHLYSARALRRMRTLLQLRMLELREERLELVRTAIVRHLSIDDLMGEIDHLSQQGAGVIRPKHSHEMRSAPCW